MVFSRVTANRLDTSLDIATPEGVEFQLPIAGFAPRCLAWLLDAVIKYTVLLVVAVLVEFLGDFGVGIRLIIAFLLLWFYNVLFEVLYGGATPGKKVLGLRVMNVDGTPVGWTGSIIRNLLRFVDMLPASYLFGLTSVMLTKRLQRLGDLAADTVVVFQSKAPGSSGGLDLVEPRPLNVPMTPDEQNVLVSFGERAPQLNKDRASELAAIIAPLMNDASTEVLREHAAWVIGRGRQK